MEKKKNKGILFKNDYKTKDNQPEYKGNALIECPYCQGEIKKDISSWVNKPEGKKANISIVFNEPYVKKENTESVSELAPEENTEHPTLDDKENIDDLPF